MASILEELKRRRVFKVVASYAVLAWLLIQISVSVEGPLGLPPWSDTLVIVAVIIGFPVCALLAWLYDLTSRGIERTAGPLDSNAREPLARADKLAIAVAGAAVALLLATGTYLLADRLFRIVDTIAVLPFELVGVDDDAVYLGDGLRDGLIMRLSRLQELRIKSASRESSLELDARVLGDLLDVEAICRGRVTQRGGSLAIMAELVDANDGAILWRSEFPSESSSLLAIEGEISREIVRRLGLELTEADQDALARQSTNNPAAHRLYQQGRYFWNRRTADGFVRSIDLYDRAAALDPNYALAYAGLADTYLMILGWGIQPPSVVADAIVENANRAILRDSTLAQPHAALGYYKTIYERDWSGAREAFLTAIDLNSNYSSAHHWYAFLLLTEGNTAAAIEEILLARESEPLSPIINAEVGYFYIFDRQYERALEELETASSLDPNYFSTLSYQIRANALLGRREAALAYLDRWRETMSDNLLNAAYGAMALPLLGLEDEARDIYEQILALRETTYLMPGFLGALAATLGDNDTAFMHFEESLAEGSLVLSWLRDPLLDPLRSDPRFDALLERVGLQP